MRHSSPITAPTPSASVREFERSSGAASNYSFGLAGRTMLRQTILPIGAFLLYVLLNRPEIILLSRLGMTAWYPAAGLAFAVMLAVGPRYMPVFCAASALAGVLIYHQPFASWGTVIGAPLEAGAYAVAAYVLRNPIGIDRSLSRRGDVLKYLIVAFIAAIFSTFAGVACLWADHTIVSNQLRDSGMAWFFGDAIGLCSVAPFLLIHVLLPVRKWLAPPVAETLLQPRQGEESIPGAGFLKTLEVIGHAPTFVLLFWLLFGETGHKDLFYLAFLPIIWIAMRSGTGGAVSGLLALNFGIVVSLHLVPVSPEALTELSGVMLVVSATGLILGAAVTERGTIADELRERGVFLNALIGNSPFGIVVEDRVTGIHLVNGAFADLFQYNSFEVIGKNLQELTVPADLRNENSELIREVRSGHAVHKTVRRMRKDGQLVDVEVHIVPTFRDRQVQGSYVIYKDISDQVKAAAAVREHAEAMNRWAGELELRTMQMTLLNEMGGLLQSCENGKDAYAIVGQSAKNLFGGTRSGGLYILDPLQDSLETMAVWGTRHPEKRAFPPTDCWSLRTGRPHRSECPSQSSVCAHVDNSVAVNYLCVPLVAHGETLGVLTIACDSDDSSGDVEAAQKTWESQERLAVAAAGEIALSLANLRLRDTLRDQSIRDPLTGLFNRRFLQESLDRELEDAKRKQRSLAVIFLDLDRFKHFNDTFGHDAGDRVLQSLAGLFRSFFRVNDVICRYGGEEFAVILPESSAREAATRAEALRLATKELELVHRGKLLGPVTLSMGIAGFPDHGRTAQELLDRADKCLYQSKANGRDRVTLADP